MRVVVVFGWLDMSRYRDDSFQKSSFPLKKMRIYLRTHQRCANPVPNHPDHHLPFLLLALLLLFHPWVCTDQMIKRRGGQERGAGRRCDAFPYQTAQ